MMEATDNLLFPAIIILAATRRNTIHRSVLCGEPDLSADLVHNRPIVAQDKKIVTLDADAIVA